MGKNLNCYGNNLIMRDSCCDSFSLRTAYNCSLNCYWNEDYYSNNVPDNRPLTQQTQKALDRFRRGYADCDLRNRSVTDYSTESTERNLANTEGIARKLIQ